MTACIFSKSSQNTTKLTERVWATSTSEDVFLTFSNLPITTTVSLHLKKITCTNFLLKLFLVSHICISWICWRPKKKTPSKKKKTKNLRSCISLVCIIFMNKAFWKINPYIRKVTFNFLSVSVLPFTHTGGIFYLWSATAGLFWDSNSWLVINGCTHSQLISLYINELLGDPVSMRLILYTFHCVYHAPLH